MRTIKNSCQNSSHMFRHALRSHLPLSSPDRARCLQANGQTNEQTVNAISLENAGQSDDLKWQIHQVWVHVIIIINDHCQGQNRQQKLPTYTSQRVLTQRQTSVCNATRTSLGAGVLHKFGADFFGVFFWL